jgi:DNA mismatch endonuclease (patch repair protein)
MADIFTATRRSEIMSRIKSCGTMPETALYACVRGILGRRWRVDKNVRRLPGRPDLLIPGLLLAIFADGCFYHSCPRHKHVPKSNKSYWIPKLQRNRRRDNTNRRALRRMGFTVWSFWEHDLKKRTVERTALRLQRRLCKLVLERRDGRPVCPPTALFSG